MDFSFFDVSYINFVVSGLIIYFVALDFFKENKREYCGIIYIPTKEMKHWEWLRAAVLVAVVLIENNFLPVDEFVYNCIGLVASVGGYFFFKYYYKRLAQMLRHMYRKDPKKLARIIDQPRIVFYAYLLFSMFTIKHLWFLFH